MPSHTYTPKSVLNSMSWLQTASNCHFKKYTYKLLLHSIYIFKNYFIINNRSKKNNKITK